MFKDKNNVFNINQCFGDSRILSSEYLQINLVKVFIIV